MFANSSERWRPQPQFTFLSIAHMRLPTLSSFSSWRKKSVRALGWLTALGTIALLTGCDLNFWRMTGHQSTISVDGPVARTQRDLFYVTCWVTLVIFILVGAVLAYATLKFRAKTDADEHAEPPEQGHGNPLVEVGLIGASVLALVVIAVPTLKAIMYTYDVPKESKETAYEVNATGFQWWFKFEYPDPVAQIPSVGPLVVSNELVIPAGRPVRVNLRTLDVIHSFWVPKLSGKVDMIPNRANFLWFEADAPGYYWGQCAEYCGDSHAVMRFRVIALSPKDFNNWLDQQMQPARTVTAQTASAAPRAKAQFASLRKPDSFKTNEYGFSDKWSENPAQTPLKVWQDHQVPAPDEDAALIAQGRKLFQEKTCAACHAIRGHMPGGSPAYPDLTHVGSRTTIAAGLLENNAEQLQRWIHNPGAVKPGNKMWVDGYLKNNIKLTPEDETALVAYLQSLK
jgi:cytochrome c oxidase subunit 2